jgi:hypothetical protein
MTQPTTPSMESSSMQTMDTVCLSPLVELPKKMDAFESRLIQKMRSGVSRVVEAIGQQQNTTSSIEARCENSEEFTVTSTLQPQGYEANSRYPTIDPAFSFNHYQFHMDQLQYPNSAHIYIDEYSLIPVLRFYLDYKHYKKEYDVEIPLYSRCSESFLDAMSRHWVEFFNYQPDRFNTRGYKLMWESLPPEMFAQHMRTRLKPESTQERLDVLKSLVDVNRYLPDNFRINQQHADELLSKAIQLASQDFHWTCMILDLEKLKTDDLIKALIDSIPFGFGPTIWQPISDHKFKLWRDLLKAFNDKTSNLRLCERTASKINDKLLSPSSTTPNSPKPSHGINDSSINSYSPVKNLDKEFSAVEVSKKCDTVENLPASSRLSTSNSDNDRSNIACSDSNNETEEQPVCSNIIQPAMQQEQHAAESFHSNIPAECQPTTNIINIPADENVKSHSNVSDTTFDSVSAACDLPITNEAQDSVNILTSQSISTIEQSCSNINEVSGDQPDDPSSYQPSTCQPTDVSINTASISSIEQQSSNDVSDQHLSSSSAIAVVTNVSFIDDFPPAPPDISLHADHDQPAAADANDVTTSANVPVHDDQHSAHLNDSSSFTSTHPTSNNIDSSANPHSNPNPDQHPISDTTPPNLQHQPTSDAPLDSPLSHASPAYVVPPFTYDSKPPWSKTRVKPPNSLSFSSLSLLISRVLTSQVMNHEEVSFVVTLGQDRPLKQLLRRSKCHDPLSVALQHCPSEGIAYMAAGPTVVLSFVKAGLLQLSLSRLLSYQFDVFDPGGIAAITSH